MALDANDTARIYDLFGIPQAGTVWQTYALDSLFGPFGEEYTFSSIITELDARLVALTATQELHVEAAVDEYETITPFGNLEIHKSASGSEGRIIDDEDKIERIRQYCARKVGFKVPVGGYLREKPCRRIDK